MLLHEVNIVEGLVQGVVAEQPVPRYEKKAGNGKAGEDLEQQEQVQPGGGSLPAWPEPAAGPRRCFDLT